MHPRAAFGKFICKSRCRRAVGQNHGHRHPCFCRGGSHGNRDFRRHRKTGGGGNPCAHNRFCKRGGVSRNGVQKRGLCYGNGSQALFGCRAGHRLRKPCRGDLRSAVLYFQIALLYNVKRQVLKVKFFAQNF